MLKLFVTCAVTLTFFFVPALAQDDEREKGIEFYRLGNFAEAVRTLQKVVEADPKNKVAWTYLGGSLVHLDRVDEAVEAFRKPVGGLKYDPKFDKELKMLKRDKPRYTRDARANNVSGSVAMWVEFKADGTIGFIIPVKTLPDGLTEEAIASVKSTVFSPAEKNGKPVPMIRMISTQFDIY